MTLSPGAAGRYDFTLEQGADFARTVTYLDGSGVAVNLTGYTAKLKIKDAAGTTLVSLTQAAGLTLGGALGTIAIAILAATTVNLAPTPRDSLFYDLFLTSPGGAVTKLLYGTVAVAKEIST